MGFVMLGRSGRRFPVNRWYWLMYLDVIQETGIFSDDEIEMMSYNDGFYVSHERAKQLASALAPLDTPDFLRKKTYSEGDVFTLNRENIRKFVTFLEGSEGVHIA